MLSQFASEMANTLVIFVLSIIIYKETGSKALISYLWISYVLGSIISHLLMGPLIDRINRKIIMLLSEWGRGIVFLALIGISFNDSINPLLLIFSALCVGFLEPMFHPACMSYVSIMVDKSNLKKMNSKLEIIAQTATIAGPGIGGILVSLTNELYTLVFITIILFISGLLVLRLPNNKNDEIENSRWIDELLEGFSFYKQQKVFLLLAMLIFCVNIAFGAIQPLLLPFIEEVLDKGEFEFGLANSAIAIGMILGSLLVNIKVLKINTRITMLVSLAFSGFMMTLMGLSEIFYLFIIFVLLDGLFTSLFNINNTYLYQVITPEKLIGRVFAVRGLVAILGLPIGAFIGGMLSQIISLKMVFLIMSVLIIVPCLVSLTLPALKKIDSIDSRENTKIIRVGEK